MSELETKSEEFADELCDEALDRAEEGLGLVGSGLSSRSCRVDGPVSGS